VSYIRCGGIFKYEFVANLPLSANEGILKSVTIWGSYGQEFSVLFFLTHNVVLAYPGCAGKKAVKRDSRTVNRGTVKRGQLIAGQLIAWTHNRSDN